jgi:predicted metal-dependent HD superfamily phosphohydrolase
MFDQCKWLASNPDALELAVWFHDVIFEPGKRDNEKRSAQLYLQLSEGVHDESTRSLVDRLIMATLHDGSSLADSDAIYMVDIDLSSFGLSWEEFLQDSQNLRRENAELSDAEYYRKKANFQNFLLAKERFYLSDYFAERLETQARANLARYFEYLNQQL